MYSRSGSQGSFLLGLCFREHTSRSLHFMFGLLILVLASLCPPAHAGGISGSVRWSSAAPAADKQGAEKQKVVIWLEEDTPTDQAYKTAAINLSNPKIVQKNLQFVPDFLVIVKGQTVDMPNLDDVAHNVYSFSERRRFNVGLYLEGDSRAVTFDKVGVIDLYCSVHREMHARVLVVPTPYFAVVFPGGTFSIANVPPGNYTLKVWSERARMLAEPVVVPRTGLLDMPVVLDIPRETAEKK